MKSARLPILLCHANCPKCGLPTEFKMFAGGFNDFSTYVGAKTGSIYRVDQGKVHYQKISLTNLLSPAVEREGSLTRVPEEIRCKLCNNVFSASSAIPVDGEEIIEAYEL